MYKSAFAKTQKSALKQLHQLLDLYCDVDLTEECRMTLGEWMDKWLDEYMIFAIRESTLDSYRTMVKNQVKPFIGNKQLASLTTADVQKFYNKIKKEGRVREHPVHGKTLADSMVRGIHMMLHEALDTAVKERLIAKNPTNGTTVPKCNYPEKQILGDNQLETFLKAIKGHEYWCDFFYVEVMTGLRRGEICGLRWKDINFATGELHIRRQVVKKGAQTQITKPKTKSSIRTLILPPDMLDILAEHKKTSTCEWVFPSPVKEGEPRNPDSIYGKFQKILKRAQCKKIRFHDLRHTFATMALENGIGGTDAEMPEPTPPKVSDEPSPENATETVFEPYKGKIRKPGTGCVTMINDHLYEGRFTPRVNGNRLAEYANLNVETSLEALGCLQSKI